MNVKKKLPPINIRCERVRQNAYTHIYILENDLTRNDYETNNYSVSFRKNFTNVSLFVEEISKQCNRNNVLIYSTWNSADFINNVVNSLNPSYEYLNLTIINFSCVFKSVVYIPENLRIRKIVNVFKFYPNPRSDLIMPDNVLYNQTYMGYNTETNKKFHFRLIKNDTIDNTKYCTESFSIEDSWWFKWYFSVPLCASGRLQQITGTCWFNATLNALLLTPFIAELLKNEFKNRYELLKQNYNFDSYVCINSTQNLEVYLFQIVYLVLIKEDRAIYSNGNIVKQPAIALKNEPLNGPLNEKMNKQLSNSKQYGENLYHPDIAMIAMLNTLFKNNPEIYKCLYYNEGNFKIDIIQNNSNNIQFIVLLKVPQTQSGLTIFIDNNVYVLESGVLGVQNKEKTKGHVVSGLKCDDLWYIYDSNNKLYECKWFLKDCDMLHTKLKDNYPFFHVLIYVKSSLTKTEYVNELESEIKRIESLLISPITKIQHLEELRHKLGFYKDHITYTYIQEAINKIRIETANKLKDILDFEKQISLDNIIKQFKALNMPLDELKYFTEDKSEDSVFTIINKINVLKLLDLYFKKLEIKNSINKIASYLTEYKNLKQELENIKFTKANEYGIITSRIHCLEKLNNRYQYFSIIENNQDFSSIKKSNENNCQDFSSIDDKTNVVGIDSNTTIGGSKYIRTNKKIELGKNKVRNIYVLENNKRTKYVKYKGSFLTVSQAKKLIS
jgi:hypothetical protein